MGKKNSTRPTVYQLNQLGPQAAMNFVQQITQIMALHRYFLKRPTFAVRFSFVVSATSDGIVLRRQSYAPQAFGDISLASNLRWLSQMGA